MKKVTERTTDDKWWQYLTWPFGSGELKRGYSDPTPSTVLTGASIWGTDGGGTDGGGTENGAIDGGSSNCSKWGWGTSASVKVLTNKSWALDGSSGCMLGVWGGCTTGVWGDSIDCPSGIWCECLSDFRDLAETSKCDGSSNIVLISRVLSEIENNKL
jgi:hypothetical protein